MPDARRFIDHIINGVVPNRKLVEHTVFKQRLNVAAHRSVTDLPSNEKAVVILAQLNRLPNREPVAIVQRQNLNTGEVLDNGFGERTLFYDVAAIIHVSED